MKKKKIGLYGGTFSPPHYGHIRAAESFISGVELDELYVMPANIPPHKMIDAGDDPKIRLEMCRAAFGNIPKVTVSDYEIEKSGVSYTIDTLEHLTENGEEVYLLCGDDMFLTLESWRRGEDILRTANIVLMRRYDGDDTELCVKASEYEKKYGTNVIMLDSKPYPMSSTEVRERVANGEDVSAFIPDAVSRIISRHGLYRKAKVMFTDDDVISVRERVKPYLTEQRYSHTLAVEREAAYLGSIYLPENVQELRISALLHDITKKCDFEKQLQYCSEFGIINSNYDMLSPKIFHAKTAAELIKRDFPEYAADEIVRGVRWHTTGRDGMDLFESIVYLADYIEETRTFPDCVELRKYFRDGIENGEDKTKLFYRTMIRSLDCTLGELIDCNAPIDLDTVGARNYFIRLLVS